MMVNELRHSCPAGEIFATDNTATITDPADPRLTTGLGRFAHDVRAIIRADGAFPGRSNLLDGVFWDGSWKEATYERSREFDVDRVTPDGLRHIADTIAKRYHQESVLTFRCLPPASPETDAVEIQAPDVGADGQADITRLHDALLANPAVRDQLGGGSVTLGGRLILIAPLADLPMAEKFTKTLGVDWNAAEVSYGAEKFVS